MELHEYPRPVSDTGIGVHWTPGYAAAAGLAAIREKWLPELRTLGAKWVKIYNHDGALDFAELLLTEGFQPVVRIYRSTPNPGRLTLREVVHVDSYVRVGVRYFEFNSEPDRDSEWKGGRVPANGLDLLAEDTIVNLEAILERGGMPAIPALSNGSTWDLVGAIVAKGRKDLFEGPVWQAVHNYARNRPLDYPYDIGNQEGASLTERFYRAVAEEPWDENAWRGRTLAEVNRLRMDRCSPASTIKDDHACWLAFQHFDALNRHHLGRSLPIIASESGYLVGEDSDARYPATTPNLHLAQTLEACRILMGASTRFPAAPDYLFAACFSVFANQALGGSSAWWEKFAWYSPRWPGGSLPIVRALRAEPKVVRRRQGNSTGAPLIRLHGAVLNARERHTVYLQRGGIQVASALIDTNSRYSMPELAPGSYSLRIVGLPYDQPVNLTADRPEMVVNIDLGAPPELVSRSVVTGFVDGGAGAAVSLLRHNDGEEFVTMPRDDGAYRFIDMPAGDYTVRVSPQGVNSPLITLDGRNHVEVNLAYSGWGYTVRTSESLPSIGAIHVKVRGRTSVPIRVHNVAGSSHPVLTGSDPSLPADECQIASLENGVYVVTADGLIDSDGLPTQAEARVTVDRKRIPLVEFSFHEATTTTPQRSSVLHGRVIGPLEQLAPLSVRLIDPNARVVETPLQPDGAFAFHNLSSGAYTVQVVNHEASAQRTDIALDGANQVSVDLLLPMESLRDSAPVTAGGSGVIRANAQGAAGQLARLVDGVGNELRQSVGADDWVNFAGLPAGDYTLTIEGGFEAPDLSIDGVAGLEVTFAPLTTSWESQVTRTGSMPGYALVRVEVPGHHDLPVYIWKEDWEGQMKRTGSSSDSGPFIVEFAPLGPGAYMIEPDGLGIWTDVELSGLESVWVTFRQRSQPSLPNRVAPLVGAASAKPAQAATVSSEPAAYHPRHYVWLGDDELTPSQRASLRDWAAQQQAQVGDSLDDALLADMVTLVGDVGAVEPLRRQLVARGIAVQVFSPPAEA